MDWPLRMAHMDAPEPMWRTMTFKVSRAYRRKRVTDWTANYQIPSQAAQPLPARWMRLGIRRQRHCSEDRWRHTAQTMETVFPQSPLFRYSLIDRIRSYVSREILMKCTVKKSDRFRVRKSLDGYLDDRKSWPIVSIDFLTKHWIQDGRGRTKEQGRLAFQCIDMILQIL